MIRILPLPLTPATMAFRLVATASLSINADRKIYAATAPYFTAELDVPASQPFDPSVDQPVSFSRSIIGGSGIGQFTTGQGTLTLVNTDGSYDDLIKKFAIDGRDVVIKIGDSNDLYTNLFPLFVGTAANWNIDEQFVTIALRDFGYKLDVPLQTNLYGGTGGADGTSDLAGKRKPLGYGTALNVSPAAVNPSLLIYQAHDGACQDIPAVYDRGASLTKGSNYATYALLAAATVAAGTYATCLAQGFFRLGSTPAGTVTCDLSGDNTGSFAQTSADIVRRILDNQSVLTDPDDLYVPSFAAVNTQQSAPVGYWAGPDDNSTIADVVARLMDGIGGWGGFRRNGKFEVAIFAAPASQPSAIYTRADIISIIRKPIPANIDPPPWRWRVGYQRNYTIQSDLAGSVSAARVAFVAQQYRTAEAASASIKADHPFAQDPPVGESYFANASDATAEAARRLALYRATAALYEITIDQEGFMRNNGETIFVTYPRWDLITGRSMVNVQIDEDGKSNTVKLTAYG